MQKLLRYESFGSIVGFVFFVLFLMLIGGPMLLVCLDIGYSWVGAGSEQDGSETPGRVAFSLSLGTGEHPAPNLSLPAFPLW